MDSPARARILRRRNGLLQACDPCRLRKVACDHGQPVCQRCRKRKQDAECTYTANAATSSSPGSSKRPPQLETQHARVPPSPTLRQPKSQDVYVPSALGTTHSVPQQAHVPSSPNTSQPVPDSGYLGPTSHATVFNETTQRLSLLRGPNTVRTGNPNPNGCRANARDLRFQALSRPMRESCLAILHHLPGLQYSPVLVVGHVGEKPGGWDHYMVASVIRFVRDRFGTQAPSNGDLELLAELINHNTIRPLRDIHTSSREWLDQFCGANLRWETVGIMLAYLERVSDALGAARSALIDWAPDQRSSEVTLELMNDCLRLALHYNQGNDLTVDLHRRRHGLESMITGDASFATWTAHGNAVAAATSLGLHLQSPDNIPYRPSLCSEYKRMIFGFIFGSDKVHSSFSGRPPLLSGRFCTELMPLDLAPEELIADDEALQTAVASLDKNGWNTSGKLHSVTMLRAKFFMTFILEEIIDIALAPSSTASLDQLNVLKMRQLETMAQVPSTLAYDPNEILDPGMDVEVMYARILVNLAHLQNLFFIERLRLSHGAPDEGELLITSFDLVTMTMVLWTHKDRFIRMRRNFEWLLMAYAAPGGGILCLELLRPTFFGGSHPKDSRITRSKIIQNLSLLAAFLDWVQPSAPNGNLCINCKVIIEHVLDHHLNAPAGSDGAVDALQWDVANPYDFTFELLDTFDWLRSDGRPQA